MVYRPISQDVGFSMKNKVVVVVVVIIDDDDDDDELVVLPISRPTMNGVC